ncbi:MAG TPA: hypothetical protein VI703_08600 [Anaerolineales bacterium]|nr:hypothetical protein [Anaerolineales bacterium]
MTLSPRLLFLSFLAFGLVTGLFVGSLGEAIAAPAAKNTQQNTLIVLVDDLGAENPVLEGIWLAVRSQGDSNINWVPIYPAPLADTSEEYTKPHMAFYLPHSDFDDPSFLPPLRAQGAWWDEVFWLDLAALSVLQSLATQPLQTISEPWVEPQRALYEQVQALNALCQSLPTIIGNQGLDQFLALIPGHVRSSTSPFELITRWDSWMQQGFPLSCTHPWAD